MRHLYGKQYPVLANRERGAELATRVAAYIEREVVKQAPGEPIALDFIDIEGITVPFAEAFFGRLLGDRRTGLWEEHPFCIVDANEDVRSTVAAALEKHGLIVLSFGESGPELLGGSSILADTLKSAFESANDEGEFRVSDVADLLSLSPQAANNRLRPLLQGGALSRSRTVPAKGGKEFVYRMPAHV
jgi:STAS-like domain of unknown function (DUF4325)